MGKMKDAWPIWTLVIAGVIVIALAFSQNKVEKDAVTLQDIFPDDSTVKTSASQVTAAAESAISDPVISPAIVSNTDHESTPSFAVQLYSFKDQSRADTVISSLKSDGVPAYVQISDLGAKGTWYRVRVGSYKTPDEAKAMLVKLQEEHKDSIIVKEKK